MTPLDSTAIQSADYDAATKRLTLQFRSGGTYHYDGVSQEDFEGLTRAKSAGAYFHSQIKPAYSAEKVEEA